MKDFVPKGTGNSRYLKSVSDFLTIYPDYASFAKALIAGTLPVDFNGLNADGVQQTGTALNKANLLTDATAATLGLTGDDVTVNDALKKLSEKAKIEIGDIRFTPNASLGDKWLLCNGEIVDSDQYPVLYNMLPMAEDPETDSYNKCDDPLAPNVGNVIQTNGYTGGVTYVNGYWVGIRATLDPNGRTTYWGLVCAETPLGPWQKTKLNSTVTGNTSFYTTPVYLSASYVMYGDLDTQTAWENTGDLLTGDWEKRTLASTKARNLRYGNGYWVMQGDDGCNENCFAYLKGTTLAGTWVGFDPRHHGAGLVDDLVYYDGYWHIITRPTTYHSSYFREVCSSPSPGGSWTSCVLNMQTANGTDINIQSLTVQCGYIFTLGYNNADENWYTFLHRTALSSCRGNINYTNKSPRWESPDKNYCWGVFYKPNQGWSDDTLYFNVNGGSDHVKYYWCQYKQTSPTLSTEEYVTKVQNPYQDGYLVRGSGLGVYYLRLRKYLPTISVDRAYAYIKAAE